MLWNSQKAPMESNEWISAMKTIASVSEGYIFSKSQLADFLALAVKGIEQSKTSSGIIFKMYRDIIENYDNFSDNLKSNYPGIIVDVISVINRDFNINPISIEKFYLSRKQEAAKGKEKTSTMTTAAAIHKEKLPLSTDELIVRLVHITNRDIMALQKSIERLTYADLKKISELCRNYSKLEHYSKLITKEQLKNEIQREIDRS